MIILHRLIFIIISSFFILVVYALALVALAATEEAVEVSAVEGTIIKAVTPAIKIEGIPSTPTPVGDYVVGPGRTEVQVKPGETVIRYITVANRIANDKVFSLAVEDMSGTADGSENVVLLGDINGPYSLRDFVSFPVTEFTLQLNTRAVIPVVISMPPTAEPGGYYGAVLVSTHDITPVGTTQAPRSPMIARVGTLFFITVPGETEITGELKDVSTTNHQHWYQSGPINFNIVFENTGSVHLNPYGEVRVTNLLGEEVGFVELDPWFVLPKSLRLREVIWDREFLLGRYTFKVKINRGYDDVIDEKSFVIWVLPWKIITGVFIIVFIILFSLRFFFRTFEFRRKV